MYYLLGAFLLGAVWMNRPDWAAVVALVILVFVADENLRAIRSQLHDLKTTMESQSEETRTALLRSCSVCGAPDANRQDDESDLLCESCRTNLL